MAKKRLDKKIPVLEPSFKEILVCKPKNARPYMEVFIHEPENVFQQNLGTLFGVLEINDESPDSSYVVNYLISVIKKEFFSNIKRGTIESFEAALHKANVALSKLAEHDHISWIGHINAICAVAEKNNIHLASTGSASALLLRSKSLVNISEGGEDDEGPNPLKTFQEVISGRMEDGDKIIITTDEIFNIFSLEEIKRSAIKFSQEDFFRFLNTALVNELERAAVLIADVKEKIELEPEPARKPQKLNAFSQSAFAEKNRKKEIGLEEEEDKSVMAQELKKELEKTKEGYTDEKTGHIYMKDDGIPDAAPSVVRDYSKEFFDHIKSFGNSSLKKMKKRDEAKKAYRESLAEPEIAGNYPEEIAPPVPTREEPREKINLNLGAKMSALSASLSAVGSKIIPALSSFAFYTKLFIINRIFRPLKKLFLAIFSFVKSGMAKLAEKKSAAPAGISERESFGDYSQKPEELFSSRQEKKNWFSALSGDAPSQPMASSRATFAEDYDQSGAPVKRFLPSWEKIKRLFARFSGKEKMIAGVVVAALIIIPYFIAKALEKSKSQEAPVAQEIIVPPAPLENDQSVVRLAAIENMAPGNFDAVADVNGKIFAIKENSIVSLEDQKEYEIASEFQDPDFVFSMDDLNLIFLYKDGKIISFHAVSRKFQNNNIDIPGHEVISGAAYLTYGYFMDPDKNQIYRYPRAEGGFGEKTNWLKDDSDLSGAKDMAINENVYATDGKNISKFYRGKKQDFAISETATPLSIDHIYTKPESENLYALDKNNSRIIKLDASGQILAQYYHPEIGTAFDFAVSEEAQKVYITGENGVGSFGMEQ